jgi:hypothetical protein
VNLGVCISHIQAMFAFDSDTPALPNHRVAQYLRGFASLHGINSNDIENPRIRYNTRVELIDRRYNSTENGRVRSGWTLTLKEMLRTGGSTSTAVWTKEESIFSHWILLPSIYLVLGIGFRCGGCRNWKIQCASCPRHTWVTSLGGPIPNQVDSFSPVPAS